MKKILVSIALLLAVSVGSAFGASALAPGSGIDNPDLGVNATTDFSLVLPGWMAGGNLVDTLVSAYVGAFTGTVTSKVHRNPADGFLGFEYVFTNTTVLPGGAPPAGPVLDLVRATIGDATTTPWAGWLITDAGADGTGTSTAAAAPNWTDGDPNVILRDPTISGEGLTVQWRFPGAGGALVGTTIQNSTDVSARIFFVTDATHYATTNVGLLDTGAVSDARAFAPSIIPEPATLGLLGIGGLGFLLRRRRRKQA